MHDWDLYDERGNRKYLTATEREEFLKAIPVALTGKRGRQQRTFALLLYYSGCRISEALELTHGRVDYKKQGVMIRTLKRRSDKAKYRFIPLPNSLLTKLDDVHHVLDKQKNAGDERIWSFNRKTGWAAIKKIMAQAEIEGAQATAHGLRHSFVIAHQQIKTPPHMIQEWLGWASTEMLGVYGRAMGQEERNLAAKLWE